MRLGGEGKGTSPRDPWDLRAGVNWWAALGAKQPI